MCDLKNEIFSWITKFSFLLKCANSYTYNWLSLEFFALKYLFIERFNEKIFRWINSANELTERLTGQSSLVANVSVFGSGGRGIKPRPSQIKDFKIVMGSCYLPVMVVLLLTESTATPSASGHTHLFYYVINILLLYTFSISWMFIADFFFAGLSRSFCFFFGGGKNK